MVSTETFPMERNYLGAASSSMNDIGNDDFAQILHIEETSSDSEDSDNSESRPIIHKGTIKVPEIRMNNTDNSISHALDSSADNKYYDNSNDDGLILNIPEKHRPPIDYQKRKASNASEISISSILDQDIPKNDSNALTVPVMTQSLSDVSISHILDQA